MVVGIPADDLETVIERASGDPSTMPVFLTDDDRFEIFRRHGAIFEYLPPIDQAPDLDVDIYRLRRLALFRRKWRPAKIVAFGGAAAELVRTWRASPFEDGQINELTGGPPVEPA